MGQSDDVATVVHAGQSVQLICTARRGNPVPTVTLLKNGQSFGPSPITNQNTHTFVALPEDNNAVYGCFVQNMVDRHASSDTFQLNILSK